MSNTEQFSIHPIEVFLVERTNMAKQKTKLVQIITPNRKKLSHSTSLKAASAWSRSMWANHPVKQKSQSYSMWQHVSIITSHHITSYHIPMRKSRVFRCKMCRKRKMLSFSSQIASWAKSWERNSQACRQRFHGMEEMLQKCYRNATIKAPGAPGAPGLYLKVLDATGCYWYSSNFHDSYRWNLWLCLILAKRCYIEHGDSRQCVWTWTA